MSLQTFVNAVLKIPSITTWTRLEPLPREGSMTRSLQAQVRDPLWFLTRQWQVGEFLGDDAGSPVQATLGLEQRSTLRRTDLGSTIRQPWPSTSSCPSKCMSSASR